MRIPFGKKDLPILKKSVKIIRKELSSSFNREDIGQNKALNELSEAMGYIDFKQIKRLSVSDTVSPIPEVSIEVIHSQITNWLEFYFNGVKTSELIPRLNYKSLSVLSKAIPKMLILDEMGFYYDKINKAKHKNTLEYQVLNRLKIPLNSWSNVNASPLTHKKNVLILDDLIVLLDTALKTFVSERNDKTTIILNEDAIDQLGNKIKYDLIPMALKSSEELIGTEMFEKIEPFGFKITEVSFENSVSYILYNQKSCIMLPEVFLSYPEALSAKAQLLSSSGYIQGYKWTRNFPDNAKFTLSKGTEFRLNRVGIEETDSIQFLRTDIERIPELVLLKNEFKLLCTDTHTFELNKAFLPQKQVSFKSIQSSLGSLSSFLLLSQSQWKSLNELNHFVRTVNDYIESFDVGNEEFIHSVIKQLIKYHPVKDEDNSAYINTDYPEEFADKFKSLLSYYPLHQIDHWHDEFAEDFGYRARGGIHLDEIDFLIHLFIEACPSESTFNKSYIYEYRNVFILALIVISEGIEIEYISKELQAYVQAFSYYNRDISLINNTEYSFKEILEQENYPCINGPIQSNPNNPFGRSMGGNFMHVSQSIEDFYNESIGAEFPDIDKSFGQLWISKLNSEHQAAIRDYFVENDIPFVYEIEKFDTNNDEEKLRHINFIKNTIHKIVKGFNLTSSGKDIKLLSEKLIKKDCCLQHLREKPDVFLTIRLINGRNRLFMTTYYEDCETLLYSGKISDIEKLILEMDSKVKKLDKADLLNFESALKKPELAFNYYNINQSVSLTNNKMI